MQNSDLPTKIAVPFASSAVGGDIRAIPVTTVDPNAASFTAGFPPPTFTPISGGGVAPDGRDFNGLFLQMSEWTRWQAAGGTVAYDSVFAAAVGGYPAGAVLRSTIPGNLWLNTTDNNATDPDAAGAGWTPLGPSTGDAKLTMKTTADYGWIMMNDGTIGDASSNATALAAATASALFALIWTNVANTWAPLLTSAGAPVARGLTAAADFAAHRQLTLPPQLGRATAIAGAGAGLTSRALGQSLGEETHALTAAENGPHTHTLPTTTNPQSGSGATVLGTSGTGNTSGSSGSGTPHNTMQPTAFWNVMIKL